MDLPTSGPQQASLLTTKFCVPPTRPNLVLRPRLVDRLHEGFRQGCRLTLISAPAGYGKTTLLAEWIADRKLPPRVAWLVLDEGDNDAARFFAYLLAALQRVDPDIGQAAQAMVQAPQPPLMDALPTSVINDIFAPAASAQRGARCGKSPFSAWRRWNHQG
jgi:LuxR family maltose regulon positive regulatory protein